MRIMLVGDAHKDISFATSIMSVVGAEFAKENPIDKVVFLGDFGALEHRPVGVEYFDSMSSLSELWKIPIYFIFGNHDNRALVMNEYVDRETEEGFLKVRDGLYAIPNGTRWTWGSKRFIGLGGAYSVDKFMRLENEKSSTMWRRIKGANVGLTDAQMDANPGAFSAAGTLWFPDEEMTDDEVEVFLKDTTPVDVILAHDKPRASSPGWNRKDFPQCIPNQDRLQKAVRTLQPELFVHGHLHYFYEDDIICGDDNRSTHVVGLNCNHRAAEEDIQEWSLRKTFHLVDC